MHRTCDHCEVQLPLREFRYFLTPYQTETYTNRLRLTGANYKIPWRKRWAGREYESAALRPTGVNASTCRYCYARLLKLVAHAKQLKLQRRKWDSLSYSAEFLPDDLPAQQVLAGVRGDELISLDAYIEEEMAVTDEMVRQRTMDFGKRSPLQLEGDYADKRRRKEPAKGWALVRELLAHELRLTSFRKSNYKRRAQAKGQANADETADLLAMANFWQSYAVALRAARDVAGLRIRQGAKLERGTHWVDILTLPVYQRLRKEWDGLSLELRAQADTPKMLRPRTESETEGE